MVRTNSKTQQYWLYFLKPYNYLFNYKIEFLYTWLCNKALVHTQPSIVLHTYYNVYPLDLLIAR